MNLLALPLIILLISASLSVLAWGSLRLQRILAMVGTTAHLGVSIAVAISARAGNILVTQLGNWPAPFGISLVADLFSSIMLFMVSLLGVITVGYSLTTSGSSEGSRGYYIMLQILLLGASGVVLTGDLFDLFVWLEVMIIASFVLMSFKGSASVLRGSVKYTILTLIASSLLLLALGMLYGVSGTLNMADLGRHFSQSAPGAMVTIIGILFLLALGMKSAIFPLFFWLPDSYHVAPAPVTAIFSGILTKVGVYALIRIFTLVFVREPDYIHNLILIIAGATMVTGVLGAVAQNHMRRLLSFHIVSQIGYPLMGLGIFTPVGLAAAIFFLVHIILVKATLFFVNGIVALTAGSNDLKRIGGLYRTSPGLAILFLLPALSLAGIPPFSGFAAKLSLVRAGVESSQYAIVAVSLLVSVLTLFSMTKIWQEAFWKSPPQNMEGAKPVKTAFAATVIAVVLIVVLSLAAGFVFDICLQAGNQLLDPSQYIDAVLGGGS